MVSRSLICRVYVLLRNITSADMSSYAKILICGGDFRQLLSVVRDAPIPIAATASVVRYPDFLQDLRHLELTVSMRTIDAGEGFVN